MKEAFRDFAQGNFEPGLCKLGQDKHWEDGDASLDGPFYLGFPCAKGWGEALLTACLLNRYAAKSSKKIQAFSRPEACSILSNAPAFRVESVENFCQARSKGARSPLAILRSALTGALLELPFERVGTDTSFPREDRANPLIGIAWASVSRGNFIDEKSIPLVELMSVFDDVDAEVISFQRKLGDQDCKRLHDRFKGRCSALSDCTLDAKDQTDVMREVRNLDCMVTISTTTAHVAASLGIPVVLLAAKRPYQQWFWRAQQEHSKMFYTSMHIVLGGSDKKTWWKECLEPVKKALLIKVGMISPTE